MPRTDYDQMLEELDEAFAMDKVYVCRDLIQDLDRAKKNVKVKKYYEDNAERLERVRGDIDKITELLALLNSTEGWTKCAERNDTTVYFQKTEGSPMLMTKAETLFPATPQELPTLFIKMVSLFNETDLLPRWFPRGLMKSSDMLLQVSKFSKIVQPKLGLPVPINLILGPRECILEGKGYDMSERRAIAISLTTLPTGERLGDFQVPDSPEGYTRFFLRGAYYFELKPKGISFKLMQQLDLNSSIIPTPVMNWLAKGQLPFEFIRNLKKTLAKFEGSDWEARIAGNPDLYEDVKGRLEKFLEKEGFSSMPLEDDTNSQAGTMKKKGKLRRSLSNIGKKLSTRLSRGKSMSKKKDGEEIEEPEPVPEEPEEKKEQPPPNTPLEWAYFVTGKFWDFVDAIRGAIVARYPELKEKYPIIFKDYDEF